MKRFVNILVFICLYLNLSAKDVPYHFGNTFKITISDKLELRKDGDFYTKILADSNIIPRYNSTIVFQQKGLSDIVQKSFNTYCRILIQVIDCEDDETYSADRSDFSTDDYDFFIQSAYNNIAPPQKMVKKPVVNVLQQNGYNCVKVSYIRTGQYGNVEVAMYYLFNLKKAVMMTTSYNIPDEHIWKDVVENAFKSFRWDTIYKEETMAYHNETPTYSNYSNDNYSSNYYDNTTNYSQSKKDKSGVVGLLIIMMIAVIVITILVVNSTNKNNKSEQHYSTPKTYNPPVVKEPIKMIEPTLPKPQPTSVTKYVNYSISGNFDNDFYMITKVPAKGTIVYPHRRNKVQRRGYTEYSLEARLRDSLPFESNYEVIGDANLCTIYSVRPYEPDIAIVEKTYKTGLRIDIEIDEPYSAIDNKPIHYIGCGDDYRDKVFNNLGWLVIRFSEKQIFQESDKCIAYIQRIMSVADKNFHRTVPMGQPSSDKRWTEAEAKIMIVEKYREKLLNHTFGVLETDDVDKSFSLKSEEKAAQAFVKPVEIPSETYTNIDGSNDDFEYDAKLVFEPLEHIYRFGNKLLTPVSNVVSMFFQEFDSIGLSAQKSGGIIREQIKLIETWESKGAMAREVGTQLHLAIENYFQRKPMPDSYRFKYSGRYINIDQNISIKNEIAYFKNFLADRPSLKPFRTEWRICDMRYGIAGSIDFICRNGNQFDIYDWKRSKKSSPDEKIYRYGRNGLSSVPDISYWHYALQQNLYRYIVENNYGLKINKMHIVVLYPDFSNYKIYEIPRMDKEINVILNFLKNQEI